MANFHAINLLTGSFHTQPWNQTASHFEVIHPQAHSNPVLGHQLSGQAPTHTDITKIIYNRAEHIPDHLERSQGKRKRANVSTKLGTNQG